MPPIPRGKYIGKRGGGEPAAVVSLSQRREERRREQNRRKWDQWFALGIVTILPNDEGPLPHPPQDQKQ